MEQAAEVARSGNLAYLQTLPVDELIRLQAASDEDGRSLLHAAAASGNLELCRYLYEHGGNDSINKQDDEGWSPLHTAASCGHDQVLLFLISSGGDVNMANSGGRTPLHYAASKGHVSVIRVLVQHGANLRAVDVTGSTALHRAASAGKEEAVCALFETSVGKSRLEVPDKEGNTPLLLAVASGHKNLAMYLITQGADVEASNKAGETPLSLAGDLLPALKAAVGQSPMEQDE